MIAFGSQRSGGGDLATHLSNAEDNEYVELADLRGSIASELHGAFSEWEAQSRAMTRAKNYLYSLSVNPDPAQGRLTREQYEDYINRAEESLGLGGQPRAVVFHIKEGRDGELREHCHVVWSRTDIQDHKAIPISFDRQKLMMVAREFARDHGLKLPDGYHKGWAKADQLSLYEKAQQDQTGLTKEERMALITDLWRQSDTAKAFIAGLEENGYILATGRRPYVLVDLYGHMNALPKMIDDKNVRTKDIRAFLEKDYPPDSLPDVEEARRSVKAFRDEREAHRKFENRAEELEILKRSQDVRREKLEQETAAIRESQRAACEKLVSDQSRELQNLRAGQAAQDARIQFERARRTPQGLAGFLARASGIAFLRRQINKFEDRKRDEAQAEARRAMEQRQDEQRRLQEETHRLQMAEQHRKEHAQEQVFTRERRSLETAQKRERAVSLRRGAEHMPALNLSLGPPGRRAVPAKAARRFYAPTAKEANVKARTPAATQDKPLREIFSAAASPRVRSDSGSSKGPQKGRPHDRGGKRR